MSTSLLVDSLVAAGAEEKLAIQVEAVSMGEFAGRVEEFDVILVAPQIRHMRKQIEKLATSLGKPVALIEMFYYATMNGKAVLEQVKLLVSCSQEGHEN
jgi:PTS system cellobiose-specific IIB component